MARSALAGICGALLWILAACGGAGGGSGGGSGAGGDDAVATTSTLPAPGLLGNLDWGRDGSGKAWTAQALAATMAVSSSAVGSAARSIVKHAEEGLSLTVAPVKRLDMDGELFSSQAFKDSDATVRTLDDVFYWALCARIANAELAPRCQAKAHDAVIAWSTTYVPTGNPIDESNLYYLMLAVDVLRPVLQGGEREGVDAWLTAFDSAIVRFDERLSPSDTARVNNRHTWSLANAALVAGVRGDGGRLAAAATAMGLHAGSNLGEGGSSYDFRQRDALHYHVYDLEAYQRAEALTPGVTAAVSDRIDSGLRFLRPFYTGAEKHLEFVNTTVAIDFARKDAGEAEWQNLPWEPRHARELLKLARILHPDVAVWTQDLETAGDFHPVLKLLVALKSSSRGTD